MLQLHSDSDKPVLYANSCSHNRANDLFWESLRSNFTAIHCASSQEIQHDQCTFDNVTALMAGNITSNTNKPHGVFYLETNADVPFSIEDYKSFKNIQIHSKNAIDGENEENKSKEPNAGEEVDENSKSQNETVLSEGKQYEEIHNEEAKKDKVKKVRFDLPDEEGKNEIGGEQGEGHDRNEEVEQNEKNEQHSKGEGTDENKQDEKNFEDENDRNGKNETKNDEFNEESDKIEPVATVEPVKEVELEIPNEFEGNQQNETIEAELGNEGDQAARNETAKWNKPDEESDRDKPVETTEPNSADEPGISGELEGIEPNRTTEIDVVNDDQAARNQTVKSKFDEEAERSEPVETTEPNREDESEIPNEFEGIKRNDTVEVKLENKDQGVKNETAKWDELDEESDKDEPTETTEPNERDEPKISNELEGIEQNETRHLVDVKNENERIGEGKGNETEAMKGIIQNSQTEANQLNGQNKQDESNKSNETDSNDEMQEYLNVNGNESDLLSTIFRHISLMLHYIVRVYNIIVAFLYLLCACVYDSFST